MKKQGAIALGIGGYCCKPGGGANLSAGTFYDDSFHQGLGPPHGAVRPRLKSAFVPSAAAIRGRAHARRQLECPPVTKVTSVYWRFAAHDSSILRGRE